LKTTVLIIGGGLSGLHTAHELNKQGMDFLLLESRSRLGGRILSRNWQQQTYDEKLTGYDMGPAWFWPGQTNLENLVHELEMADQVFYQQETGDAVYENDAGHIQRDIQGISMAGSYRLQGGIAQLIANLHKHLPEDSVKLDATVTQITKHEEELVTKVTLGNEPITVNSESVVIAAPPRVALQKISFEPELPEKRIAALNNIKTWMAGHAKLVAFYETPFWLEQGYSGDCISQTGPMHEIHDASPKSGGPYALFGFMGVPAGSRDDHELLKQAAIEQLVRLFGEQAATPLDTYYKDWAQDDLTSTTLDQEMLTSHPTNNIEQANEAGWGNRLVWSGTETSNGRFNGYLEGALEASFRTLKLINNN
jgi:monoamine oxidase